MSRHEPLDGDPYDGGQAPEGNRPAQNARVTTPGTLSTQGYQGSESAGDFLGLDAEVGAHAGAFGLMAQADAAQASEPEPEPSAWVETDAVRQRAAAAYEDDGQEDEVAASEQGGDGELHGSWSESEPKRGGAGKLVGATVGVLVLGMLGVAGMKFMGAAGEDVATTEPLASNARPRSAQNAGLAAPVAVDAPSGPERTALDPTGEEPAPAASDVAAGHDVAEVDPQAARDAFEETRGDEPPAWSDATLDAQGEPADTGWSEEAEAVTRASVFVGDPIALLVSEGEVAQPEAEDAPPAPMDEGGTAADSTPVAIVADAGSAETAAPASAHDAPEAALQPVAGTPDAGVAAPVVVASAPSPTPAVPGAGEGAAVGPARPSDADTLLPPDGAVASFHESRQSRTSTLKVEDVLLAPTLDSSNLRQADAKDLSGVWNETSVPMQAMASKSKVLTPNVGRVRVVLTSKDIFEGRLYAVGQGSVWLESEYGRISVDGKRIASVANIDTKEGTPALGSTGSQNLTGLEKVRVKTPGGTFYGKVIARDDTQTTLITEDGARLTLSNADVEILTDAPKVTIGGKVEEPAKKP